MNKKKELIWTYLSMKKGVYDNDYYFYNDGTILHHYDQTMSKLDLEEIIYPSDISDFQKEKIIKKCKEECTNEIIEQIKKILHVY